MIYSNERWLTIHWDEGLQAVWMEWKGYVEGEELRGSLDAGLGLVRQKKSCRWLADCRNLGPVRQDDQHWTNVDWFPRAAAGGVRWMAMIQPRTSVARLSVKSVMSKVNNINLVTAYFDDLDPARQWLRDVR